MKAIAISIDEYVYKTGGKYYGDNVGFDIVKRYAENFDEVHLISRVKQVDQNHLEKHDHLLPFPNIVYYDVPFFASLGDMVRNYTVINRMVDEALLGCDRALVRAPSILGFVVLRRLKKVFPFSLEVVANPYEMFKGYRGKYKILSLMMHFALKHYCKKATALAFVTKQSQQARYELNREMKNNTHYSSIELKKEFFSDIAIKHNIFSDSEEPLRITHVANIISGNIKGHKEVINVAEKLIQMGRKVIVCFAGSGPDVDYYRSMAVEKGVKAEFVGFIDKNQLRELLLDTDFFLFPSKSEGLPKVLIEAMALSVPSVASSVGGIPELLPVDNLFDSYDVEGMAKRIYELASDKEAYLEVAKLMYNTALEYESSVLSERRTAFYYQLKNLV